MEKISRRQFLQLSAITAGMGVLAGCGANKNPKAIGGGHYAATSQGSHAKNWGMLIDSSRITEEDIMRMQAVCHKAHNVPDIKDPKSEIKWIWAEPFEALFGEEAGHGVAERFATKPITTLCNHCRKPVCCKVCPTQATYANEEGVVIQDMHRCIGCRNCMAACPYGSRSFNFMDPRPYVKELNPHYPTRMKGVVEKCDFCVERLAKGEAPLCVEASNGAILFGDLDDPASDIAKKMQEVMAIQRRPSFGTNPKVFYQVDLAETTRMEGGEEA